MKDKHEHREPLDRKTFKDKIFNIAPHYKSYNSTRSAMRISLTYIILGLAWILISDRMLYFLPLREGLTSIISMVKGWIYVLVTGIILFVLMLRSLNKIHTINKILFESYEKLAETEYTLQEKLKKLSENEERYRLVSEAANDGIWDEKEGKRFFSERWHEMTGYSKGDIDEIGDWMSLIHPDDIEGVMQKLSRHKEEANPNYSAEYRLKFKDGQYRWILSKARLIFDETGEIIRSAGSHTDITDLTKSQERLKELAYKDFLTNLPNRVSLFSDVTNHILDSPNKEKALIFFDIDNFKHINDTVGHIIGDQLIIAIGERLKKLTDHNKSMYRNSGDEFVIFIHSYETIDEIEAFVEELIKYINTPYDLQNNHILNITISIGIALYPLHGKDIESLFKRADMAMYKSKLDNRGRYTFYHEGMENRFRERMLLGNKLRGALERDEFTLHYQPQIDGETDEICRLEALLRWENKDLGSVPPSKFIEIAEETHLINPIGEWVLERACSFLKSLHNSGFPDINISVNVSIVQLMQEDFCDKVFKILDYHDLEPNHLELEITESAFMESYGILESKLARLVSKGISIALDDFGTGYSSLSYLVEMQINTIKIDKSFIDGIGTKSINKSLTDMIIMLGHKLDLSVVAEGIETKKQLEYLKEQKCHRLQGYYFSRPVPGHEVLNLLGSNKRNQNKDI